MAQILPHVQTGLEGFGAGLGQGIGASLQQLAQNKLQQMQRSQEQQTLKKALEPLFGPKIGEALSQLNPQLANTILSNYDIMQSQANQQQPQAQANAVQAGQQLTENAPLLKRKLTPEAQERIQGQIEKHNEAYTKPRLERAQTSQRINQLLNEIQGYEAEGQVPEGIGGALPLILQGGNKAQRAQEIFTELASLKDKLQGGRGSVFRSQLAQSMKPSLWKLKKSRELSYKDIQKGVQEDFLENKIFQNLIEKNGGREPRNIATEVDKQMNILHRKLNSLPDKAPEGSVAYDEKTGIPEWRFEDGIWQYIGS
jgi:chemotaxis protein histidine kinase CheA